MVMALFEAYDHEADTAILVDAEGGLVRISERLPASTRYSQGGSRGADLYAGGLPGEPCDSRSGEVA